MGAESFFITAIANDIEEKKNQDNENYFFGKTDIPYDEIINSLRKNKLKIIERKTYNSFWYSVNSIIKLRLYTDENYFQGLSIEGCFSWYDKNIELCFTIINIINAICRIRIIKPFEFDISQTTNNAFRDKVINFYYDKWEYYNKTFGALKFKSLPDREFYKKLPIKKVLYRLKLKLKLKGEKLNP